MKVSSALVVLLLLLSAFCLPKGDGHKMASMPNGPIHLPPHRFFLQQIFDKYGHRGVMSFEGFEHLLDSLGLGHLDLGKNHNLSVHKVNGTFLEIHDTLDLHHHDHRTKRAADPKGQYEELVELLTEYEVRNRDQQPWVNHCLSPQDILVTYGLEPNHGVIISPLRFLHLCPAIVYELDQRSCYRDTTVLIHEDHSHNDSAVVIEQLSVWLYASLSILIISLTGLLGVAMVPLVQRAFYHHLLHFLVAMAVGTLCGDALLHLMPHALMPHSHNHDPQENDHTVAVLRAAVTFFSIMFFFLMEAILHHLRNKSEQRAKEEHQKNASQKRTDDFKYGSGDLETAVEINIQTPLRHSHHSHGTHQHHHNHDVDGENSVSSVAWMVIVGDGLHNLTDGLAIGAAFSGDIVAGFATALAVFCHELPHELGDFAVLLKSGMSIKRALIYNIFSSVLSFIGMAIGVWLGNYDSAALWIYAVTAGTFLYIALADLVPEMNSYSEGGRSFVDVLTQVSGIATGGLIMLLIALYEDSLNVIFQQL